MHSFSCLLPKHFLWKCFQNKITEKWDSVASICLINFEYLYLERWHTQYRKCYSSSLQSTIMSFFDTLGCVLSDNLSLSHKVISDLWSVSWLDHEVSCQAPCTQMSIKVSLIFKVLGYPLKYIELSWLSVFITITLHTYKNCFLLQEITTRLSAPSSDIEILNNRFRLSSIPVVIDACLFKRTS